MNDFIFFQRARPLVLTVHKHAEVHFSICNAAKNRFFSPVSKSFLLSDSIFFVVHSSVRE